MAETYSFFEEGIKSYIEQSVSKYSKTPEIIFERAFDNTFLNPLFINDLSLFKDLIQKNKLKIEIWKSLSDTFFKHLNDIISIFKETINGVDTKILQYKERMKKYNKYIEDLQELIVSKQEKINRNIEMDKKKSNEKEPINGTELEDKTQNKEEDDLSDIKLDEYKSKNNAKLIDKITDYNKKIEDGKQKLEHYEHQINHNKRKIAKGKINFLKLKILELIVNILINEINNNKEHNNDNIDDCNKENNYKLLNDYINDLIEKCEKVREKLSINYIIFIKSFVIELVLIINNEGYKDINKFFLNQLLNNIHENQEKYSSDEIQNLIAYIEKVIKNPDSILCPNAFSILKNASLKKIRPRSRNNSFDKNDFLTNNDIKNTNNTNKNEKNSKIDDYFKKKKSENDEEEGEHNKKLSSIISFKNSSQNNNNNNNLFLNNFPSQLSLGLNDNNSRLKFNSGFSSNSLLGLDFQYQSSNLLNSSKLSGEDSMSKHGMYRQSFSELFPNDSILNGSQTGINSKLASQLPFLRIKKEKKRKNFAVDRFQKKLGKDIFVKKTKKEDSDLLLNREIKSIVEDKFYNNENATNDEQNKNTTASETKKNNKNKMFDDSQTLKFKDKKKIGINEVLVSKTPEKLVYKSEEYKEKNNNENLQINGIRKNLGLLFNQHSGN